MSDDIDIEEHDLLQHPALRSVFPDLACVKHEVVEISDEHSDTEEEENIDYKDSKGSLKYPESTVRGTASGSQTRSPNYPDSTSDLVVDPTTASLSPSPCVTSSQGLAPGSAHDEEADSKDSGLNYENAVSGDDLVSEKDIEKEIFDESDILGLNSADNAVSAVEHVDNKVIFTDVEKVLYEAYIQLENWGVYLASSRCYCEECQILFPTENAIAAHRMTDHSFLKETNKAVSRQLPGSNRENSCRTCPHCPATFTTAGNMLRHVRNVHRAKASPSACISAPRTHDHVGPVEELHSSDLTAENADPLKAPIIMNTCEICNAMFFSNEDLIEHLYEHAKGAPKTTLHKCDFCESTFTQMSFLERHLWSHARSRHSGLQTSSGEAKKAVVSSESAASASLTVPRARIAAVAFRPIDSSLLESENSTLPSSASAESLPTANSESAVSALPAKSRARPSAPNSRARPSAANSRAINMCLLESDNSTLPSSASGDSLLPASAIADTYKKCPICGMFLFSKYTYNYHMSVVHKRPPGVPPPSIAATTTCPHCGLSYESVSRYNIHIRNSHVVHSCSGCKTKITGASKFTHHKAVCREKSKILKLAPAGRVVSTLKNSNFKVQQIFKCLICHNSFPNRTAGRMHSRSQHPGVLGTHIVQNLQKIILKKASPRGSPESQARKANGRFIKEKVEVKDIKQKSITLLQCHICKHHFVTSSGLRKHIKNGEACKNIISIVCKLCGLTFTKQSMNSHTQQHGMSHQHLAAWNFTVKTSSGASVAFDRREAVARLPRCQRCCVTFMAWRNVCKKRCHDVKAIRCKPCGATFSSTAYNSHLVLHKRKNSSAPSSAPKKPGNESEEEAKKDKIEKKNTQPHLTVLRCETCKIHVNRGGAAVASHRTTNCNILMPKIVCHQCGLTFTATSIGRHKDVHKHSATPLTMASFTILGMSDGKPVRPELCPFPACVRCGVRAESTSAAFHRFPTDCKKVAATRCRTCRLTFTAAAYPLHVAYYGCKGTLKHKPVKPKLEQTKLEEYFAKLPEEEMAVIIDKYEESSHESWTQLYRCRECDIVVDSYDEVVEHCERHQERGFESSSLMCHVCDLRFEDRSSTRHKQLHFSRPGLDCSSFEVMDYRAAHYGTRSWIVYKYTFTGNKLSYELLQKGPERHTLYRCDCGKHCAGRVAAYRHSMSAENCREPAEACGDCQLPFQRGSLEAHAADHRRHPHLAADNCRIFRFFRTEQDDPGKHPNPLKRKLETLQGENFAHQNTRTTLYKCAKCGAHFMSETLAKIHLNRAASAHMRRHHRTCDSCGLLFTRQSWKSHFALHHQNKKMSGDDFEVQTVGDKTNNRKESNASLASKRSLKMVLNKNDTQSTLFKCGKCNAHFLTEAQAKKHMYRADIFHNKHKPCGICHFEFTQNMWKRHNAQHHQNQKLNRTDFQVKIVAKKQNQFNRLEAKTQPPLKGSKKTATRFTLYKCEKCNANFLTNSQARVHLYRPQSYHVQNNNSVCKLCGFHFKRSTLKYHTALHHKQQKFNRADFKVITVASKGSEKQYTVDPPDAGADLIKSTTSSEQMKASVRNLYTTELKGTMPTLYKCSECGVHNIKKSQMIKHWSTCENRQVVRTKRRRRLRPCLDCNLLFSSVLWKHHSILHHQLMHCARSDFTISVMRGSAVVSVEPATTRQLPQMNKIVLGSTHKKAAKSDANRKGAPNNKTTGAFTKKFNPSNPKPSHKRKIICRVYKCTACALYYLTYNGMHSHSIRHNNTIPSEKCRLCPLVFSKKVMPNHQRLHHKDGVVVEYKVVEMAPKATSLGAISNQGRVASNAELMEAYNNRAEANTTVVILDDDDDIE